MWVGLLSIDLPLRLRVYGGLSVGVPVLYFLTRPLLPPLPKAGDATCPRCSKAIHYAGYECPSCGVLGFSHDPAARDLDA